MTFLAEHPVAKEALDLLKVSLRFVRQMAADPHYSDQAGRTFIIMDALEYLPHRLADALDEQEGASQALRAVLEEIYADLACSVVGRHLLEELGRPAPVAVHSRPRQPFIPGEVLDGA
ncbi:hypothetical protein [Geopseudomonas aromaticivorans]